MADNLNLYKTIMQKALTDPDFRDNLREDPEGTLKAEGMEFPEGVKVNLVEDSEGVINVVLPIARGDDEDIFC